jgi:3-oxoacyl-[acyl-carrier protein] reductase
MILDFTNKTILITGATRGIGKQIADDLYKLGANLILTGTNPDEINELNTLAKTAGHNKKYFVVDLIKQEQVDLFISELLKFPKIDCIVNNAGINRLNHIQDVLFSDWDEMLSINLTAPFKILHAVSKLMINNNYGRVVNIASIFSKISKEKRAVYSATKFGIHGLTVGASNDLASNNILVNTVSPGFVLTDLTRKNLTTLEMDSLKNQIPAKRLAETSDISSVVIFLLSDLNKYLTGQNIIVDGGFTNV